MLGRKVEVTHSAGLGCAMADAGGPRELWHDMHCKIEELAADAILNHVEQHWRKVTLWHKTERIQIKRIH
jgi:phosphatidylserine/phosphatidylglycerophosphate/cardiolipin synthase-like enzyme